MRPLKLQLIPPEVGIAAQQAILSVSTISKWRGQDIWECGTCHRHPVDRAGQVQGVPQGRLQVNKAEASLLFSARFIVQGDGAHQPLVNELQADHHYQYSREVLQS